MTIKTIAIYGVAYSGSTILNTILGSHSKIYGGSELFRLRSFNNEEGCSAHGETCGIWTPQNLLKLNGCNNLIKFYKQIAKITGRNIIVDSSKLIDKLDGYDHDLKLWIVKNPMSSICSFLTNYYFKNTHKIIKFEEMKKFCKDNPEVIKKFLDIRLQNVLYDQIRFSKRKDLVQVKLEFLNLEDINGLLRELNLESFKKFPKPEDWNKFFHPIGGNRAPGYVISKPKDSISDKKLFYGKQKGFFTTDERPSKIITPEIKEYILKSKLYKTLKEVTGYND